MSLSTHEQINVNQNLAIAARTPNRIFSTTMALLNQTQDELHNVRKENNRLKRELTEQQQLATTDLLTGLKNRRGFDEEFRRELDRTRRKKSTGGVLVMIDLDSFKAINDKWGHQAGDACLKLVGQTLSHDLRDMDCAARLGGDEFILLMCDSNCEAISGRIQQLIARLNNLSLIWNDDEIQIRASVGMKQFLLGDRADDIFAAADESMYALKSNSKQKG